MEPLTLTTERTQLRKRYKHYSIVPHEELASNATQTSHFFYIGRNSASIDSLIRIFQTGYAAENTIKARFILERLISNKEQVPGIIILDSSISQDEINYFHEYLRSASFMAEVPMVIDATGASEKQVDAMRRLEFVDEILFLGEINDQNLVSKISFLKKVKAQQKTNNESVETSLKMGFCTKCVFKRTLDILLSSVILLAISPILIIIAIAIRLESKGSVIYISKRAGRGYKVFDFFKFRTMYTGADLQRAQMEHLNQYKDASSDGPVFFKVSNDPRITKVGLFLRNTSLDELPQLVNVLLGDMSLVGNRPLPLYEAASLTTDEWAKRFMAPAGITGLWQIKKRGQSDMSVEDRINLDIDYAEKNNFMYDLWIMANTPSALVQKSNV